MNDIVNNVNNDIMGKFHKTENILNDIQNIIEVSQKEAYRAVNTLLSQRNWLIGYRIAEEELVGKERAEYGLEIIKNFQKTLLKNMEEVLQKQIYIAFTGFINASQRFSTQCVENLIRCYLGHIIVLYFRFLMRQLVNGMN